MLRMKSDNYKVKRLASMGADSQAFWPATESLLRAFFLMTSFSLWFSANHLPCLARHFSIYLELTTIFYYSTSFLVVLSDLKNDIPSDPRSPSQPAGKTGAGILKPWSMPTATMRNTQPPLAKCCIKQPSMTLPAWLPSVWNKMLAMGG